MVSVTPGSWDRVPHPAPGTEPASPAACVSASLSVSGINKNLLKEKKKKKQPPSVLVGERWLPFSDALRGPLAYSVQVPGGRTLVLAVRELRV